MTSAPLYPIVLRLESVPCLVVGGGRVAARKAAGLLECGAELTAVAPEFSPEMERLPLRRLARPYARGDLAGFRLVLTATGLPSVDRAVFEEGEELGVLVNAADDVEGCRFFLPALLRRGPVTVAVSTGGTSPHLASWLRDRLGDGIGPELGAVAELLANARRRLKEAGRSTQLADWESLLDDDLVRLVTAGQLGEVQERTQRWVSRELAVAPAGGEAGAPPTG